MRHQLLKPVIQLVTRLTLTVVTRPSDVSADESKPHVPQELIGAWRGERKDKESALVRFEPTTCTVLTGKGLQMFAACYEPEKIHLRIWGRKVTVQAELKDGTLVLTWPNVQKMTEGTRVVMKKLDAVPPEENG